MSEMSDINFNDLRSTKEDYFTYENPQNNLITFGLISSNKTLYMTKYF